jgi:hypothetical protein
VIDYQNNVMALGDAPDLAAAKGAVEAWETSRRLRRTEPRPLLTHAELPINDPVGADKTTTCRAKVAR